MITGTKDAATGDGTPADINTPTTDVLKCSCDRKLPSGGEGWWSKGPNDVVEGSDMCV